MTDNFRGTFTHAQTVQLLAPIRPERVLKDGKNNSHVAAHDVIAHLNRVFGFGNWATELLYCEPIFEQVRPSSQSGTTQGQNPIDRAEAPQLWRYDCAYRAVVRLTIFDKDHNLVTSYDDASTGDAQNQTRADAHDLAMKSAISLALKRCAKNLGDQFGLSLYNRGQMDALVRGTHVMPKEMVDALAAKRAGEEAKTETPDVQEGVPQQESLGIDEIEKGQPEATSEQEAALASSLGATRVGAEEPTDADRDAQKASEDAAGMPSQSEGGA